jgi:signal peptidase I
MEKSNPELTARSNKMVNLSWKNKAIKEIKSFSLILVIVLGFRSMFFEPFRIPSGSMIPTLMIGDFILVNKFSYGFKVPFVHWFSDPVYINEPSSPKRGDVVVFKYPVDPDINFIKRVIAIPGDRVKMMDKHVYINGEPTERVDITTSNEGVEVFDDMDDNYKNYDFSLYLAKSGQENHYVQLNNYINHSVDFDEFTVPEGKFFVMGDNRDHSSDSRVWGLVPFENIKGKALFVWFSFILPFSDHPVKFRPWRIGKTIN